MRPYARFNKGQNYILTVIDVLSKYAWAVPSKKYNARKHHTIGMKPIDVTPAIADKLLNTVYSNVKIATPARFKVGDSVRVSKFKTIFDKGYTPNWTTEVFKIVKVQKTNPATYVLEDSRGNPIAGGFYEYELHHVANPDVYLMEKVIRKKGDEVYVK
ncbi:hypothetical protein RF55_19700, partial [Lasius niger]